MYTIKSNEYFKYADRAHEGQRPASLQDSKLATLTHFSFNSLWWQFAAFSETLQLHFDMRYYPTNTLGQRRYSVGATPSVLSSRNPSQLHNSSLGDSAQTVPSQTQQSSWQTPKKQMIRQHIQEDEESQVSNGSDNENASVAALRERLQHFGTEQHQHFLKTSQRPEPSSLTKPTRPLISKSKSSKAGPTPLPPPAAQRLQRRLSLSSTASMPATINRHSEVQATNNGYASVASLSAWLADDPTKTRRPRVLRRGANVITKSRTFDKGLSDVIAQETYLRSGHVQDKAQQIDVTPEISGTQDEADSHSGSAASRSTSSLGNVSDKQKWLKGAFQRASSSSSSSSSSSEEDDNVTASRAKEMWRSRTKRHSFVPTPARPTIPRSVVMDHSDSVSIMGETVSEIPPKDYAEAPVTAPKGYVETPIPDPIVHTASEDSEDTQETKVREEEPLQETNENLGFMAARRKLVERSQQNGNDVSVVDQSFNSLARRRKERLERTEAERKRRESVAGLDFSVSWEKEEDSGYAKRKVPPRVAPRKSLMELP